MQNVINEKNVELTFEETINKAIDHFTNPLEIATIQQCRPASKEPSKELKLRAQQL